MEDLSFQIAEDVWYSVIIGSLFIIEQLYYSRIKPYPCRYGIPISRFKIDVPDIAVWSSTRESFNGLTISVRAEINEVYLRNRYAIVGWLQLFVGQIRYDPSPTLVVRIGWLTAATFLMAALEPALRYGTSTAWVGAIVLTTIVACSYFRFLRKCRSTVDTVMQVQHGRLG